MKVSGQRLSLIFDDTYWLLQSIVLRPVLDYGNAIVYWVHIKLNATPQVPGQLFPQMRIVALDILSPLHPSCLQ
jgi:hypothetical protein